MKKHNFEICKESEYHLGSSMHSEEMTLRETCIVIWRSKWLVLIVTTIFAVCSVSLSLYLPNIYKSDALLAPASSEQSGGLSGLAGQFGGLASMAGLNIGGGAIDQTALAIEVIKSRDFLRDFISRHDVFVEIMATDSWDSETDEIVLDSSIYNSEKKQWVQGNKPTELDAIESFKKMLSVTQDKKTSLVTVSIEYYSPKVAKRWVDWLIVDINNEMRSRDLSQAKNSIEYLQTQLEQTRVSDMKSVLYQLIEEQSKTIMFAEVREEYIFRTIDSALVPENKEKPKRAIICVLGTFIGAFLSIIFVLIRYMFNRK